MKTLLSVSGDELYRGWELEKSIREWLQHQGSDADLATVAEKGISYGH
jgi:phage anti-repressor protein